MPCPAAVSRQGVVRLLDCKSRGALAAATRGAPVAPQRPAPEVLSDFRRVRRKLRLADMTILNVGMVLRRDDLPHPASLFAKLAEIQRLLAEHHEIMDDMWAARGRRRSWGACRLMSDQSAPPSARFFPFFSSFFWAPVG